jgi:hypothetical protein
MENKLVGLVEMTDAEIDVVGGGTHPSGGGGGGGNTNYGIQQRTHAYQSGNQIVKNNSGSAYASYNYAYNSNYNNGSVTYGTPPT